MRVQNVLFHICAVTSLSRGQRDFIWIWIVFLVDEGFSISFVSVSSEVINFSGCDLPKGEETVSIMRSTNEKNKKLARPKSAWFWCIYSYLGQTLNEGMIVHVQYWAASFQMVHWRPHGHTSLLDHRHSETAGRSVLISAIDLAFVAVVAKFNKSEGAEIQLLQATGPCSLKQIRLLIFSRFQRLI